MSQITTALSNATTLFGVVVVLAVLVVGFFVGRRWFNRITGGDDKDASESWKAYGARRYRQDSND